MCSCVFKSTATRCSGHPSTRKRDISGGRSDLRPLPARTRGPSLKVPAPKKGRAREQSQGLGKDGPEEGGEPATLTRSLSRQAHWPCAWGAVQGWGRMPPPRAQGQLGHVCSDRSRPHPPRAPSPCRKTLFSWEHPCGASAGDDKDSPMSQKEKQRHRGKGRSSWRLLPPPRLVSIRNPAPPEPLPASPSVAVNLDCLPRGVLSALVEAGTPLQGHTPVLMPDLRESDLKVLGL